MTDIEWLFIAYLIIGIFFAEIIYYMDRTGRTTKRITVPGYLTIVVLWLPVMLWNVMRP